MQNADPLVQPLINLFVFPGYLASFFRSLATTEGSVQANLTSCGEWMLSIHGRSLPLTILGVSLELQDSPMTI